MSVAVVCRTAHRARAGTKIWCSSGSVLEAVGEPFEKQQAEDVVLVVAAVYGAAEDVSGRPEIPFELLDVQRVRRRARLPRRQSHRVSSRQRCGQAVARRGAEGIKALIRHT